MFYRIRKTILGVTALCIGVTLMVSCGGKSDDQAEATASPQETQEPAATEEPVIQEGRVSDIREKGTCGAGVNWEYGDDGVLAVYGIGSMDNYEAEGENSAPWSGLEIKKIYIHEGVTSIGDFAFYMMESMSEADISASVSKVGYDAFDGTTWLDAQNEQFVIIGDGVLIKYTGASPDVTIPYGVKYISNAFAEYGDSDVDITSVKMPDSVNEIGSHAFYDCRLLRDVVFSEAVGVIGESAFENCGVRTNIVLPASVRVIGKRAFAMCKEMYSIELSENLENIGDFAFADSGLNRFTLSAKVNTIGKNPFMNCSDISYIQIDEENTGFEVDEIGILYTEDMSEIVACPGDMTYKSIVIPESVVTVRNYAFSGCIALLDVSLPSSVENIGESAFESSVIIKAEANTAAHKFAQENGYTFEKVDESLWAVEEENPTEVEE